MVLRFGWDVPVILRNSEETESIVKVSQKQMQQVKNPFSLEIKHPETASASSQYIVYNICWHFLFSLVPSISISLYQKWMKCITSVIIPPYAISMQKEIEKVFLRKILSLIGFDLHYKLNWNKNHCLWGKENTLYLWITVLCPCGCGSWSTISSLQRITRKYAAASLVNFTWQELGHHINSTIWNWQF